MARLPEREIEEPKALSILQLQGLGKEPWKSMMWTQASALLVTSALTLLEVLIVPYHAGNRSLADRNEALLTRGRGVRVVDIARDQLRAAAQLCAATGVKTPMRRESRTRFYSALCETVIVAVSPLISIVVPNGFDASARRWRM